MRDTFENRRARRLSQYKDEELTEEEQRIKQAYLRNERPPPLKKTSERKEKKKSSGGRRALQAMQGTAREISGIGGMIGLKIRGGGVQGTLHGGERAPQQEWDFLYEGMPAMKRKRQQQQHREFDILWG
jgi:hypothetical protein